MTTLTHLAAIATATLFSAVWQSAVLVLCVAILLRFLPGITATARCVIWAAIFLLTLALPFARLRFPGPSAPMASASLHFDPRWAVGVATLWALLSIVRAIRLLQGSVRLHRIVSNSTPFAPSANVAVLLSAAKPKVSISISCEVDTPSVAGFFHRRILLPRGLAEHIAPADLYRIIVHELEHLRRRDDWTNLVQKLAVVVFPLHPVLLWVEGRLCLERELACDDGVLHATEGSAKAYATCLANLAEASMLHRGVSLALGAWQHQSELACRVRRILRDPVRRMKPIHRAALAGAILSATFGTAVLAARSPELITFVVAPGSSPGEQSATGLDRPIQAHPRPVQATLVRAAMAEPRLTPAVRRVSRKPVQRHGTGVAGARRYTATRDIVLIEWQPDQFRTLRRTAPVQSFQLTYAAVPTRTGWLFFQL